MPTIQPASLPPAAPMLQFPEVEGKTAEDGGSLAQFAELLEAASLPGDSVALSAQAPVLPATGKTTGKSLPDLPVAPGPVLAHHSVAVELPDPTVLPAGRQPKLVDADTAGEASLTDKRERSDPALALAVVASQAWSPLPPAPAEGPPVTLPTPRLPDVRGTLPPQQRGEPDLLPQVVPAPAESNLDPATAPIRLPLADIAAGAAEMPATPVAAAVRPTLAALQAQSPAIGSILPKVVAYLPEGTAKPAETATPAGNAPAKAMPTFPATAPIPQAMAAFALARPGQLAVKADQREASAILADPAASLPEGPLAAAAPLHASPGPLPAVAPQAIQPAPQDFAALIDRLVEARQAAQAGMTVTSVQAAIQHAEFGAVSLSFQQDSGGLSITVGGGDPELARALIAAMPPAAAQTGTATGGDSGTSPQRQDWSGPQSASSGQAQGEARQQHERRGAESTPTKPLSPQTARDGASGRQSGIFA